MNEETRQQINQMSVYDLLHDNRFAPAGDPRYQGEEGVYRTERLNKLRAEDPLAYTRASKTMGWD